MPTISIREDLYERMLESKKILEDRGKVAQLNRSETEIQRNIRYDREVSFSDVLDWLFSESEYL